MNDAPLIKPGPSPKSDRSRDERSRRPYLDANHADHAAAVGEMLNLNRVVHEGAELGSLLEAAPVPSRNNSNTSASEATDGPDLSRPPAGHFPVPSSPVGLGAAYDAFEFKPDGPGLADMAGRTRPLDTVDIYLTTRKNGSDGDDASTIRNDIAKRTAVFALHFVEV